MAFQEYPKKMVHPAHQPAQWKTLEGKGVGLFAPDTIMTSPERFPDVTVVDLRQEQYHASRGYRPNNMADPVAYEQAILESAPVAGYGFQEYPKYKYHAFNIPVIVQNKSEEMALGEGWEDSPILATEDDLVEYDSSLTEDEQQTEETEMHTGPMPMRGERTETNKKKKPGPKPKTKMDAQQQT